MTSSSAMLDKEEGDIKRDILAEKTAHLKSVKETCAKLAKDGEKACPATANGRKNMIWNGDLKNG